MRMDAETAHFTKEMCKLRVVAGSIVVSLPKTILTEAESSAGDKVVMWSPKPGIIILEKV